MSTRNLIRFVTILLSAGLVAMTAAAATAAPQAPRPAGCTAAALRVTAPASIAGDPAGEHGQFVMNLVLRNVGTASCSLAGWPAMVVRGTGGRLAARVTDTRFNNLAAIGDQRVTLRSGQSAVLTLIGTVNAPRCSSRWAASVLLAGRRVTAARSSGQGMCLGGQLFVTPYYPMTTLRAQIAAMSVPRTPSGYRTVSSAEPAPCTATELKARVSSASSGASGSAVTLELSSSRACALATSGYPTLRLHLSDGTAAVAKIFSYAPARSSAMRAMITFRGRSGAARTALVLRPGDWAPAALLAPATGPGASCGQADAITVYPTVVADGAGRTVRLPAPIRACGTPRALPYLASAPAATTRAMAAHALAAAHSDPGAAMTAANASGFLYGSDGPDYMACGSAVPYKMAATADETGSNRCNTTNGVYGGYFGEIGKWDKWQSCDNPGLAWNGTNYNDANANFDDGYGAGANAYWMMAGPGRDPNYNGTTSEASAWGQAQAERATADVGSDQVYDVAEDIEEDSGTTSTGQPRDNGWNTVWSTICTDSDALETYIAPSVDLATVTGFGSWIWSNTVFFPAIYSSGVSDTYTWPGIFSSEASPYVEWTYDTESSSLSSFPSGWGSGSLAASFFGDASSSCEGAWQWAGGSVQITDAPDFRVDQFNIPNMATNPTLCE